jgi:hypothetical protein
MNNAVGLNVAAVTAADSFFVGGNWGFILKDDEDFNKTFELLRSAGNSVRMVEVSNGFIVFVDPKYLQNVLSQVEQITPDIMNKHQTRTQMETAEFQNFLMNALKGQSKYMRRQANFEEYCIGLYSCNNLHKIRMNGVEYPAYSLTVLEALKQLSQLTKYVDVYVGANDGFEDLRTIISNNQMDMVNRGLEISPSRTGVFLTVRFVRK